MNTAKLKRFATEARTKIKQGVVMMMRQWGFDADGNVTEEPVKIDGGTIFRGAVIGGEDVYYRWEALRNRIATAGLKQVYEEASYTWFNRFVAIKILSKNGLLEAFLDEVEGAPLILAQARRNAFPSTLTEDERKKALELAGDHEREFELFTFLITSVCHSTPILSKSFGKINDYTELLLPRSILTQGDFIDMLNNDEYITDEDYCQAELIGWLYQFYIAERKDEVFASFKSGKKAAKEDIPAATQIFTPNWIVKYMVQNTIGRIYLDNFSDSELASNWKYLVDSEKENGSDDNILKIENPEELTMADLGCGSGHILVDGFDVLFDIYKEQYASDREACESILEYNLVGVDIDTRAKQLAQFALLMKACKYVPEMVDCHIMPRIYDMPEPLSEHEIESLRDTLPHFFLGGTQKVIDETVDALTLLQQAQDLGSVMKFDISDSTRYAIETALKNADESHFSFIEHLRLMLVLTKKYAALCMNPPYMGSGNMNTVLSKYVKDNYPNGKADLFAVFMELAKVLLSVNGKYGMINMQSWMFLSSFEALRTNLLKESCIDNMLHLGPRTFDELSGEVVQNTAFVITNRKPTEDTCGTYYRLVYGANCHTKESMFLNPKEIDTEFTEKRQVCFTGINQRNFEKIPGCPIGYWVSEKMLRIFSFEDNIGSIANPRKGLATTDNKRFIRFWHEISHQSMGIAFKNKESAQGSLCKWFPLNKGGEFRKWYGNNTTVVNWYSDGLEMKEAVVKVYNGGSYTKEIRSEDKYFKDCITWNALTSGKPSFRFSNYGALFDSAGSSMFPKEELINPLLGLLNTPIAKAIFDIINPTLNYGAGTVGTLPVLVNTIDCKLVSLNISIAKQDWDAHETSWDFKRNELLTIDADTYLENLNNQVEKYFKDTGEHICIDAAAPRTDSIEWCIDQYHQKWEHLFMQLHANEEELNRQFINIYGLQDELTPNVPLDEVTILQQGEISIMPEGPYCGTLVWQDDAVIKQLISYAIGCFMGRYRLDKDGLHIAHPDPTEEETAPYQYKGQPFTIDEDGILPILPEDAPFTDNARQRMVEFISQVFGQETQVENMNYIESTLKKSIGEYLVKDFWKDHKKMYQNRPIYWLFTSKKGTFQCITYMHRMNEYTLERIRQKYLLPYISHLESKVQALQSRESLTTAESRQLTKLKATVDECREYHDRLHQYSQQNIAFDLDDGVVKNYALFGNVVAKLK